MKCMRNDNMRPQLLTKYAKFAISKTHSPKKKGLFSACLYVHDLQDHDLQQHFETKTAKFCNFKTFSPKN